MPEPSHHTTTHSAADDLWNTEWLRLRESLHGPVADHAEVRQARAQAQGFGDRLRLRARLIADREGFGAHVQRWRRSARAGLLGLAAAALLSGVIAGAALLGDGSRPVNLLLAWVGALGLHLFSLLFWVLTLLAPAHQEPTRLAAAWLWLTGRLARGPDAALAPRAWIGWMSRSGALRWAFAAISHAWWLLALSALTATAAGLLSARRYTFQWETTLLSPDAFVATVRALGWLPAQWGFPIPPDAVIRASDGLQAVPAAVQTTWSGWLLGALVVYGVVPRAIALAVSLWLLWRRRAAATVQEHLPGHAELRPRLMPDSEPADADGPPPAVLTATLGTAPPPATGLTAPAPQALAGIELGPGTFWPPPGTPAATLDLGIIDDRRQRDLALDALHAQRPERLLLVCDPCQTPDRGSIALISELAAPTGEVRVLFQSAEGDGRPSRLALWRTQLLAAGLRAEQCLTDPLAALAWLDGHPDPVAPLTSTSPAVVSLPS